MIAGVDGCKGGWIVAMADNWPCRESLHLVLCPDFKTVLKAAQDCTAVAVDIPIGLPSDNSERLCDKLARRQLGSRASSVFRVPPRQALRAADYEQFKSLHISVAGAGAAKQTWAITKKIIEVDSCMTPQLQTKVFEIHPELTWQRLAGKPLMSKHKREGIEQRYEILKESVNELDTLIQSHLRTGKTANMDDFLDALVGLAAAHELAHNPRYKNRLPQDDPPTDARGLRMEIWY
jgi:predicted RNase H-like nuclease